MDLNNLFLQISVFKVWVDISGARKKMKLNHGRYQQLTGETQLDEQTMHGIQTGGSCLQ